MSRLTQGRQASFPIRGCHPLRPAFPDGSGCPLDVTGLIRFRSPLLTESRLMSFPPATEMFQFAGFASCPYEFSAGYPLLGGLPHSETPGSTIARISPGIFAACHVLLRLLAPRHPPNALTSTLDRKNPSLAGTSPASNASRMKTLFEEALSQQPTAVSQKPLPYSLFTCQRSPPTAHRRQTLLLPIRPQMARQPKLRATAPVLLRADALRRTTSAAAQRRLVEVNGIEPMTSCLQSRRSPN